MKQNTIAKLISAIFLIVSIMVYATVPARAEYIDRAGKVTIYFGSGVDIFPDKVINGKIAAGLGGVKYEGPIMDTATYVSEEPFTVAKLASVWARILELDPNPGAPVPKDVKKDKWYYGAFEKLSKTHILDHLVDKNGNINPNRQIYVYEIHRSIFHYWQYSGFADIREEAAGFIFDQFGENGVMGTRLKKTIEGFRESYEGRPWYEEVAPVIAAGFVHGLDAHNNHTYVTATRKATNNEAMITFYNLTGRTRWSHAPGFREDIKIKPGHKLLTDYEKAALQSRPAGFYN